jgi:hypothetical protein
MIYEMKANNEIVLSFTEFVKRVYDEHMPKKSTGSVSSMGDYIKQVKEQLELIEVEIASEKHRVLNEAASNPVINMEALSDQLFKVVDEQHVKWMNARTSE